MMVKHIRHTEKEAVMLAVMFNGRLVYRMRSFDHTGFCNLPALTGGPQENRSHLYHGMFRWPEML
jgi:hypothetical protein